MAPSCQHCGDQHPGLPMCPRTGDAMTAPGRCGTRVDRYEVERLLGVGAFGSVFQARHARTGHKAALKILKHELMTDSHTLERFMREARTAAAVGDEHVVGVLDADVTADGVAFIAMELLDGDDLKTLARRERPLHPARVIHLLAQVLDGLAAAHDKGIVHRDMKPANIFIVRRRDAHGKEYEFAKLLDFGISKMDGPKANPLTLAGATLGTPSYMAWEQFFDARQVDGRTDGYAIAVILYELLAGKKPYEGDGLPELMQKVRIGGALPLRSLAPSLPVPLCAVIDKALATKPERRWATAREFAAALRSASAFAGEAPPLPPRAAVALSRAEDPEVATQKAIKDPEAANETVIKPRPVDAGETLDMPKAREP